MDMLKNGLMLFRVGMVNMKLAKKYRGNKSA